MIKRFLTILLFSFIPFTLFYANQKEKISLFIDLNNGDPPINISKKTPTISYNTFSLSTIFSSNISTTALNKEGYFLLFKQNKTYVYLYDFKEGDSYSDRGYLGHFFEQNMDALQIPSNKTYQVLLYKKTSKSESIDLKEINSATLKILGVNIAAGKIALKG